MDFKRNRLDMIQQLKINIKFKTTSLSPEDTLNLIKRVFTTCERSSTFVISDRFA